MADHWSKIRVDFPITKNCAYLDHASAGPIPLPVQEKIFQYYRENAEQCDLAWPKWVERREQVRERAARFIGASPEEVTFISSTSQGMNLIAEMLEPEGPVLINSAEFPSSTVPWLWRKADLIWQDPESGHLPVEAIKKLLPKAKTIVTSFVQYSTGYRQDLQSIGKIKDGRYFVVNATQGFGALPIEVESAAVDFLCTNSYKWLLAGYGSGLLYIRKKWLPKFRPSSVGWRSMKTPDKMDNRSLDVKDEAARYELGSPNFPAIFSLGAAIDYLSGIGIEKIEQRILELTDFAIQGLEKKGYEVVTPQGKKHRSGIVVFKVREAEKLRRKLFAERIYVSVRGAGIRIAPHFYNSFEEIEKFLEAL